MDISDTLAPKSDQLDAVDLLGGPRTFTITDISKGNAEQPVQIHLAEFPRPWRPGVSMRRVLAYCWGTDAAQWIGRRVELFNDTEVTFGPNRTGGTRIARLSHIDKKKSIPLLVSKTKTETYVVEPLRETAIPALTDAMIACATETAQLGAWWKQYPGQRAAIEARVAELKAADAEVVDEPTLPGTEEA